MYAFCSLQGRRDIANGLPYTSLCTFQMPLRTLLLVAKLCSTAQAAVYTGNQHLANVVFAGAPLLGQSNKRFGLCVFTHLQPPRSGQQCQVGAVGVVL